VLVARLRAFVADEQGATAIEYGLLAALISVACIAAFTTLGNGLSVLFSSTGNGAGATMAAAASSIR